MSRFRRVGMIRDSLRRGGRESRLMNVGVIVVAAGRGVRFGGEVPKQYLRFGGRSTLSYALRAFIDHPLVHRIVTVIHPDDQDAFHSAVPEFDEALRSGRLASAFGGATRQSSVSEGLEALALTNPDVVLVHDAARPFISMDLVTRAIEAAEKYGAAVPLLPVVDTINQLGADGRLSGTVDRSAMRVVQTPQAFKFAPLLDAHRAAKKANRLDFTDDGSLVEWRGQKIGGFTGEPEAFKLTIQADIRRAEQIVEQMLESRCATGYDVHAFGPGDHVWLGGVKIPHDMGLVGHSDADPVLHALTDAILGCLGDGDIGTHFPPSDPQWKGASSSIFLAHAATLVKKRGGRIVHLDATLVCEAPRMGPHREAMREAIAAAAGIAVSRVGLKATTSERLGFTGRKEGIAALATATVKLPG
jgi:2-C-methyl-D-erythritol 4-phosphate cytidylyltransferase / 2-C-methyl-D-erythritol 2,4-cyclodiphosphate synthase